MGFVTGATGGCDTGRRCVRFCLICPEMWMNGGSEEALSSHTKGEKEVLSPRPLLKPLSHLFALCLSIEAGGERGRSGLLSDSLGAKNNYCVNLL